jgi:hypothetical protein
VSLSSSIRVGVRASSIGKQQDACALLEVGGTGRVMSLWVFSWPLNLLPYVWYYPARHAFQGRREAPPTAHP